MKTKLPSLPAIVIGCLIFATAALGTPLAETTAVHTQPDASAPTISYLKAGTEPGTAAAALADTPAGWMPVELPGPFEGYVENKDLTKALDVSAGAPIRLAPQANAPVLAIAQKGDKTTITGLRGKWTQISLGKPIVGYIRIGNAPGYPPPVATAPAPSAPTPQPAAAAPAPVAPIAYGAAGSGQPPPTVNLGDSSSLLPRQFAGRFVSTRSLLRPRRPYDWALNDDAGKRYAYLDVSKLLLTEQLQKYIDHSVVVFGVAKPTPDGKDLVIVIESLQLK